MRVGLIIETLTHLILAVTTRPGVAFAVFFVFGAHAFVWGTTAHSIRQRAVPEEFQGRVGSVYMMGVVGGLAAGAAVGGALAGRWASPRPSGSRSSARPCSSPRCGASWATSPTSTPTPIDADACHAVVAADDVVVDVRDVSPDVDGTDDEPGGDRSPSRPHRAAAVRGRDACRK